jgi:dipicolinate synthase subunit B
MIGYAMCGSFCTLERSIKQMERLIASGSDILPIMSEMVYTTDTRFGKSEDIRNRVEEICGRRIIHTIPDAEPLGPAIRLDAMIVSPCTGNTLAKLAHGITDTAVCMAVKAHLRNDRPVVIALASNDALSAGLSNVATMMSRKNIYFVPLRQDDCQKKPRSVVADFSKTYEAAVNAINGKQFQPIIF